ncbi:unnamed protein product [Brassica rapa subsp. trilocularis]
MPVPLAPYPTPPATPLAPAYTPSPANGSTGGQSQLVCSGCRNLLMYPVGATSVCCAVCNAITAVPPPGTEMAQLVCGGCHTLLMYIRGATSVQCSCCHTVNLALEEVVLRYSLREGETHITMFLPSPAPRCHHHDRVLLSYTLELDQSCLIKDRELAALDWMGSLGKSQADRCTANRKMKPLASWNQNSIVVVASVMPVTVGQGHHWDSSIATLVQDEFDIVCINQMKCMRRVGVSLWVVNHHGHSSSLKLAVRLFYALTYQQHMLSQDMTQRNLTAA